MIESGLCERDEIQGASELEVRMLENALGLDVPSACRDYLRLMGRGTGEFLRGTDLLVADLARINDVARKLVADDGLTLEREAFVFAMHQGYQFLYILARDDPDPAVFRFLEGEGIVQVATQFSEWLAAAVEDEIRGV